MTIPPSLQEQIVKAVGAHVLWKARLLEAIDHSSSEFSEDKVRDDNQCDFGNWLHKECEATTRASPHYTKVKQLHAAFHLHAAKVLALAIRGKKTEAQNLLRGDYTRISGDLVTAMQVWSRS